MSSFNKTKLPKFIRSTCPKKMLLKSKENFNKKGEMKAARKNTAS